VIATHHAKLDARIFSHHALGGTRDRVMLNGTNHNVGAFVIAKKGPGRAGNREVSGLGATAGEDDFVDLATHEGGDVFTRFLNSLASQSSGVV
jgi:hypothetical protein